MLRHAEDYRDHPVLYVDDEPTHLRLFRLVFADEFTIRTARSAEEALRILDAEPVALLLADQRMPGMSGIALAERVKRSHPHVIRMIVTGYVDTDAALEAINRGEVYRFISRPWREEEMRTVLRTGIDLFRLRARLGDLQLRMIRSERLASLGFVTAGVAHDMKTPVGTLSLGIDLLSRLLGRFEEKAGPSKEIAEMRRVLGDCLDASRQLRSLLDSIRVHVRELPAERQPVRLCEVAESALRLCRAEIVGRAQLSFVCEEAPLVLGDRVQLGQVVVNLLINAAQAIAPGAMAANRVELRVGREGEDAVVAVSDTGSGIEPERLPRIFEPLYTTRLEEGGSGLGLAIVRDIVERHGGRLSVESAPGKGTTMAVRLPGIR